MIMIAILAGVILLTCVVVGMLFFLMKKESSRLVNESAVPIKDFNAFKTAIDKGPSAHPVMPSTLDDELLAAKKRLADLEKNKPVEAPERPLESFNEGFKLVDPLAAPPQPKTPEPPSLIADDLPVKAPEPEKKIESFEPLTLEPKYDEGFYKSRITQLEEELRVVNDRAVSQAQEALEMINNLTRELEGLKAQKQDIQLNSKEEVNEAQVKFEALQKEHQFAQNQISMAGSKMRELEGEIGVIKKQMGQELVDANATIDRLRAENEVMLEEVRKNSKGDQDVEIAKVRDEFQKKNDALAQELNDLKNRNTEVKDREREFEAKLQSLNQEFEKQVNQEKEESARLKAELEILNQKLAQLEQEKNDLAQQVESFNQEKTAWDQERDQWNLAQTQMMQDKLEWSDAKALWDDKEKVLTETNASLMEKLNLLQMELTRAKSQASGLEKICQNLKAQIEQMTPKT